ncbi:DUF2391 domain-containing protein [Halorubrum ezzemoulense]|uniref:DUF2391 domain-containing protein n=1 Tax=Halorubrum ezzemoulense TaxID=337243 RepID=A0A481RI32_HALEZ|nr:DUF2391 domain-containing protein [Halorubrum ezzemoulense]MDB9248762.1 DUF2391 domain-containing protein [Halorubrum ezzemoulense]MDB9251682.1 DUF2391 domain-containing protein [Halorubrum ezzemoulense]MDB9256091.1 DUF2391 domain-containing protein [Halorubrum ezzemoulense]MDB9258900.1 DUF2391 domain-containing protein [Halorubrum ezzemoulense]MDB9262521.1 DUF2391 domain-containing protein [Halorubrum ezzemoulense]
MVDSDDGDTGPADGSGAPAGAEQPPAEPPPGDPDIDDLLAKLDALRDTVDEGHEREEVRQTISLVERMPGSGALAERITKYTSRDLAESFVGAVLFALPLLVEGGVFEIAAWFAATTVAGVPVLLIGHVGFVFVATAGLLYYADFRQIAIHHPILGVIPRRYAGVLLVSLATSAAMLLFWGRLHEGDPTALERVSRVAVVWAAAAFGAGLGDILPGESQGDDLGKFDLDIGDRD